MMEYSYSEPSAQPGWSGFALIWEGSLSALMCATDTLRIHCHRGFPVVYCNEYKVKPFKISTNYMKLLYLLKTVGEIGTRLRGYV